VLERVQQGRAEKARVNPAFGKIVRKGARYDAWLEFCDPGGVQRFRFRMQRGIGRWVAECNDAVAATITLGLRFVFQFVHEFWIHRCAQLGERLHQAVVVGIENGDHAGGSIGGLAARLAAFNHEDAQSGFPELPGEGEADNTSADNDDVVRVHEVIVKGVGVDSAWCMLLAYKQQ